jgi:hypothetical protein
MATAKNYLYINIDGKAKKIGKFYYDVEGLAKKVQKAYIRDENGKAMLVYVEHVHSWSYNYKDNNNNSSHTYTAICSCGESFSGSGSHSAGSTRCSGWHTDTINNKHYDHYTCKYCGGCASKAYSHTIQWEFQSTTATCTSSGYNKYKCANCSTTKQEYQDKLGHNWVDATCTTPKTCTICKATSGKALGHSWSTNIKEWVVKAATCTEEGFQIVPCKNCSATDRRVIAVVGHAGGTATCTKGKICTYCGAEYSEPLGHTWKDATCTAPKTCSRCGATEGSALGHRWVYDHGGNNSSWYKCSRNCGVPMTQNPY